MQQNKQQLSAMKRKVGDTGVEELRPGEPPAKINSRWTNDELLMAVTAVRKYGKGFPLTYVTSFEEKCSDISLSVIVTYCLFWFRLFDVYDFNPFFLTMRRNAD